MEFDDEWELLSDDDGFLQISANAAAANQIYSRNSIFRTNYFLCPSPTQFVETTADRDDQLQQHPIQINIDSFSAGGVDPDPISQVFFRKMKEAEFADIKVESPKFEGNFQLEEKIENENENENEKEVGMGYGYDDELEEESGNVCKWRRLSGIGGAICSFGVAAATFCIIVFTKHPHHSNRKHLHFRIYTDDHRHKRMKVKGGAIAAVSGVPLNININRARITVGGYYHHDADADAPPPLSI